MAKNDIVIEIKFNVKEPEKTVIKTNAKKEAVEEILDTWLSEQMGKGEDKSKPDVKSEYTIKISLDLRDDSFYTHSDTNNKGVTCGIVMDVFQRLDKISIIPLS